MADTDKELLQIFIEEGTDLAASLDASLRAWGGDPTRLETITDIKRDLHTLKGSARMVGQLGMGAIAHSLETLAEAIEQHRVEASGEVYEIFCNSVDQLEATLEQLKTGKAEIPFDKTIRDIVALIPGAETIILPKESEILSKAQEGIASTPKLAAEFIRIRGSLLEKLNNLSTENAMLRVGLEQYISNIGLNLMELRQEIRRLELQLSNLGSEIQSYIAVGQDYAPDPKMLKPIESGHYRSLDQMNSVLRETAYDIANVVNALSDAHSHTEGLLLNQARISTEIQHRLSDTRLTPFESVVPRLGRIVRQVSQELDKKVDFKVARAEGEMDRGILERLLPSLEHIIRNSIDHGIESQTERVRMGKSPLGNIEVSFSRKGSIASIEIRDDGAGINIDAVRKRAIQNGRIAPDEQITEAELLRLILEPGFSTRESVTEISGRGVGMDVVNTAVNELGGSLTIESEHARGTIITLRFPFTTSLNRVLMFYLGSEIFGIQLNSIDQVVLVEHEELEQLLTTSSPILKRTERSYHLHYLGTLINKEQEEIRIPKRKTFPVILFSSPDYPMALLVDSVLYSRELVVQALGAQFKLTSECSGGTVLGDGRMVFILDLFSLSKRAMSLEEQDRTPLAFTQQRTIQRTGKAIILVVDDSISVRTISKRLLERNGYQVILAKDGLEALQRLDEQIPDLILLDLDMPRMDGYEFAANLQKDERKLDIPIIVISSRIDTMSEQRKQELNLKNYIKKPFQESDLISEIESILGTEL